jgi:PASTA domain
MPPESQPGAPGDALDEATTQADGEWPVAAQYRVLPESDPEQQPADERGAVTVPAPPQRRWSGVPTGAVVAALLGLLLLAGAFAAWLVTRPETSSASAPPARSPTTPASTTPHQGGSPTGDGTTGSTSTETSSATTTRTAPAQTVAVPEVVGLAASEASRKLRNAKLEPRIRLIASSRAEGTVLAQAPAASSRIDAGATVELRVAKRTEPAKAGIPRLVGSDGATAKSRLRSLGLHWSVTTRASARPRGTVLAQAPSPGARVTKGTTVSLTVSSGQAQVSVPDVTGLDEANARAQLVDAGFDVSVVDEPATDPSEDGVVVDQSPSGGSSADKGSSVTITVKRSG